MQVKGDDCGRWHPLTILFKQEIPIKPYDTIYTAAQRMRTGSKDNQSLTLILFKSQTKIENRRE